MSDEKNQDSSSSGRRSGEKRRYFRRRRRKGKKTDGKTEQGAEATTARSNKGESTDSGERRAGPPRNKKRRSRRRSSGRQRPQQVHEPESEMRHETERTYEEPTSVYVYTHIVRPAYRDAMSDYRPESSFSHSQEFGTYQSSVLERLQMDIRKQLDAYFEPSSEESVES